jgi:hypothetical protein
MQKPEEVHKLDTEANTRHESRSDDKTVVRFSL